MGTLFLTSDGGKTWEPSAWDDGLHGSGCPIYNGEFYMVHAGAGARVDKDGVFPAEPIKVIDFYDKWPVFKLSDVSQEVRDYFYDMKAIRWTPETGRFIEEKIAWPTDGIVVWCHDDTGAGLPGYWTRKAGVSEITCHEGELFATNYYTMYEADDGGPPKAWDTQLYVSGDNGRSWARRANVTKLEDGTGSEASLAINQAGEFVAVMRSDFIPGTLFFQYSKDKGYTWSTQYTAFGFGVCPRLKQLDNGIMVLSAGRNYDIGGTFMSFSPDGGHSWTEPIVTLQETGKMETGNVSCGYTHILPTGPDTFLYAYADKNHKGADGELYKSILVREITVKPKYIGYRR